jgi:Outer membrane protein beta-barrel domain
MRRVFFMVVMLLIFSDVDAQQIGVKGGFDLSTNKSDKNINYGYNPGLNVSIFLEKELLPFLWIRPEFGYYQKGYSYELFSTQIKTVYDYLEFSFVARLNVPLVVPLLPVYVIAGPYAAYAIGGNQGFLNTTSKIDFGKDKILPFEFGVVGGLGLIKDIAIMKFFVEAKYEIGLIDIK